MRGYLGKTFGPKVEWFSKAANSDVFSLEEKAVLRRACDMLRTLLPARNRIVHGETHQVKFPGKRPEFFRVGMPRSDREYLNKFVSNPDSNHVFNRKRVIEVTEQCKATREMIGRVSAAVMKARLLASMSNEHQA
jgi:hypothetical protein